jgi:hypothetical protein
VNIFVFLLPLKNIVPGKKRIFEGGKEISLGNFFSTFLSLKGHPLRDRKVEKKISQGLFFSTFKYPFLPWTIFFSGTRQTKLFTRAILFS